MIDRYDYRCEATSLEGFVQQLAVAYIARGRYFYHVSGKVPDRLTPHQHDERMIEKYDVAHSKWSRYRRKKRKGPDGRPLANVQYLRYREFWVLLCTDGYHKFFTEHQKYDERDNVVGQEFSDVRKTALKYGGYSIGYAGESLSVRLASQAYRELKSYYLGQARQSVSSLEWEFSHFPYPAWGGVLKQEFAMLKGVNATRKAARLPPVSTACICTKRNSVKPFGAPRNGFSRELAIAA